VATGIASAFAAPLTQSQAGGWLPGDNNLLAASSPTFGMGSATILSAGTLYMRKIKVRSPFTATSIWFDISVVGAGASSGSSVGLLSVATGTLLSGSADIGASLLATGPVSVPLTTPQAVTGDVWAAIIVNLATTQPTLRTDPNNAGSATNLNLATAVLASCTNGAAMASVTPSANVSGPPYWFGIN
jgi:hypothetical protein